VGNNRTVRKWNIRPLAAACLNREEMHTKGQRLLNKYLLAKPTLRMLIEWPFIIIIGILGEVLEIHVANWK